MRISAGKSALLVTSKKGLGRAKAVDETMATKGYQGGVIEGGGNYDETANL